MKEMLRRTWAQVNLNHLEHNLKKIKALVGSECKVMAVVKADGYGHGAVKASKVFEQSGADYFGVSNIDEAKQLRRNAVTKPILIFGYTPPENAGDLIDFSITQTVYDANVAKALSDAAVKRGTRIKVHIKVDTGMSRIGFLYHDPEKDRDVLNEVLKIASFPGIELEGVFTHFAVADEMKNKFTERQFFLFSHFYKELEKMGVIFPIKHCCNSAGVLNYPEYHLDMVRPGILLYGFTPNQKEMEIEGFYPAMELKTIVSHIKTVEEGTPVSYGMIYKTPCVKKIATLPIGYADGYSRILSNGAEVIIDGKRAQIVGRICMDQCMADVTAIDDVKQGDEATVFGKSGAETISVEEIAENLGTVNYEIICQIGKRVPRLYIKDGKEEEYMTLINLI
jgi:alanine racemase